MASSAGLRGSCISAKVRAGKYVRQFECVRTCVSGPSRLQTNAIGPIVVHFKAKEEEKNYTNLITTEEFSSDLLGLLFALCFLVQVSWRSLEGGGLVL